MAITTYADAQDVRDAYEGTISTDAKTVARLESYLRRANAKLAQLVPSLDRRMAEGKVDPEIPTGMVVEAVLRVWRNPAGMTQEGVGPFQASRNSRAAQNEILFDKDEINWLLGESGGVGEFRVAYARPEGLADGLVDAGGYYRRRLLPPGV